MFEMYIIYLLIYLDRNVSELIDSEIHNVYLQNILVKYYCTFHELRVCR